MTFSEGWHDQYRRMLRSHERLIEAAGPSALGSDEARDRLYHFFQDAYHLKDWVKNDSSDPTVLTTAIRSTVEAIFDKNTGILALQLAADLCNGIKHLGRDRPGKTGDKNTAFTRQDAYVTLATIEVKAYVGGAPAKPKSPVARAGATGEHRWFLTSNDQQYNAVDLADDVVVEWTNWLRDNGLLP